jgi:nanoRNase/pAp phosphatase (c-di-AMP/oligoRNAs hydrolase)
MVDDRRNGVRAHDAQAVWKNLRGDLMVFRTPDFLAVVGDPSGRHLLADPALVDLNGRHVICLDHHQSDAALTCRIVSGVRSPVHADSKSIPTSE